MIKYVVMWLGEVKLT